MVILHLQLWVYSSETPRWQLYNILPRNSGDIPITGGCTFPLGRLKYVHVRPGRTLLRICSQNYIIIGLSGNLFFIPVEVVRLWTCSLPNHLLGNKLKNNLIFEGRDHVLLTYAWQLLNNAILCGKLILKCLPYTFSNVPCWINYLITVSTKVRQTGSFIFLSLPPLPLPSLALFSPSSKTRNKGKLGGRQGIEGHFLERILS